MGLKKNDGSEEKISTPDSSADPKPSVKSSSHQTPSKKQFTSRRILDDDDEDEEDEVEYKPQTSKKPSRDPSSSQFSEDLYNPAAIEKSPK